VKMFCEGGEGIEGEILHLSSDEEILTLEECAHTFSRMG
jgi:hypothetical protein